MDFGPLRSLVRDLNFGAHGVPATVTRPAPDDTPIATRVIWLVPMTDSFGGGGIVRREPPRVLGIRIDEVATIPRGTLIVAPEWGQAEPQRWRVDGIDRVEADHTRVFVVLDPELS